MWICFLNQLNQSNTTTGPILATHHCPTLRRHQPNQVPLVSCPVLDPLSSAWPCLHGPGCTCGLHVLSGLHDDPKTVFWSQWECAHGPFLHELPHTLRADRRNPCLDRLCVSPQHPLLTQSFAFLLSLLPHSIALLCRANTLPGPLL